MKILLPTLILLIFTVFILWAMQNSFAKRRRPDTVAFQDDSFAGDPLLEVIDALHVSTTRSGSPLERVQIEGLRFRGYTEIQVSERGVRLTVKGENSVYVSVALIKGVGTTQMRLGKATEKEGMAAIVWQADQDLVESAFRFKNTEDQIAFIETVTSIMEKFNDGETK